MHIIDFQTTYPGSGMVRILYGYARKRYNPFFWSNINLQDTALLLSYFLTTKTEIIVPQKDLGLE